MKKIVDRLNNRPTFQGQSFTKESMTIPGQALTPQEIMRRFVQGPPVGREVYLEQNISALDRMDKMQKLDYLQALKEDNIRNRNAIETRLKNLQQEQQAAAEALKLKNEQKLGNTAE